MEESSTASNLEEVHPTCRILEIKQEVLQLGGMHIRMGRDRGVEFVNLEPWQPGVESIECISGGKVYDLSNAAHFLAITWKVDSSLVAEFRLISEYLDFAPSSDLVDVHFYGVSLLSLRQPHDWTHDEVESMTEWVYAPQHGSEAAVVEFSAAGLIIEFLCTSVEFVTDRRALQWNVG